jgi:hypothetical protein
MSAADKKSGDATSANNNRSVMRAVCVGAILGGVWGWLYLTSRGSKARDRIDPAVDRIVDALEQVQTLRTVVKSLAVLALVVGSLGLPTAANASTFFIPWIGGNASAPTGGGTVAFGGSAGVTAKGIVDVDLDSGYTPGSSSPVTSTSLLTLMADVTFGIPVGERGGTRVRPYVTAGAGVIRSHTDSVLLGVGATRHDVGIALGGGITVRATHHVGVRADLRHMQTLQDTTFAGVDTGRLAYWRTTIGVVIR